MKLDFRIYEFQWNIDDFIHIARFKSNFTTSELTYFDSIEPNYYTLAQIFDSQLKNYFEKLAFSDYDCETLISYRQEIVNLFIIGLLDILDYHNKRNENYRRGYLQGIVEALDYSGVIPPKISEFLVKHCNCTVRFAHDYTSSYFNKKI